jgi:Domain of unknown function (DUF4365)
MAKRTESQKTGSRGHRLVMSIIEQHPDWLARDLSDDFGIDAEAELTDQGLTGAILKLQIKASMKVQRRGSDIKLAVDRRYVEYAASCRYPMILVMVDVAAGHAWYLWLQKWRLENRDLIASAGRKPPKGWTVWINEQQTLVSGLDQALKDVAEWRGQTQLVLSLQDAIHAALATFDAKIVDATFDVLQATAPRLADTALDIVLQEAIRLGNRMRGTFEGNIVADRIFRLVRLFGDRVSSNTIATMVLRGDSCSRVGLTALGILYDEHRDRLCAMGLPELFRKANPDVAWYCAFREAFPDHKSAHFTVQPVDFEYAGFKYVGWDGAANAYANRGPSALLDRLVISGGPEDPACK